MFGLVSTTVKVIFQRAPGEWADLSAVSELAQALEDQPDLSSLPIQVSGEEMLHLPLLHALASVISIANVAILAFFMYAVVYVPQLPAPWSFMCALPAGLVFYNGYAALSVLGEEYLDDSCASPRRTVGSSVTMLVALLGPDAMLFLPSAAAAARRQHLAHGRAGPHLLAFGLHVVQTPRCSRSTCSCTSGSRWNGPASLLPLATASRSRQSDLARGSHDSDEDGGR